MSKKCDYRTWLDDDRTKISVKPMSTVYTRTLNERKTSLAGIKKIYRYLNGGTSGLKAFEDKMKDKYVECGTQCEYGIMIWDFDEAIIMAELQSIPEFAERLEEENMDNFDKLHYWAVKEA